MNDGADTPTLRTAEPGDLAAIVAIYNYYVTRTHVTFDVEAFSVAARRPWFEIFRATGPYRLLVAESTGSVVGYASSLPFKPKPGYRTSVETTIYLERTHAGRGIGFRLYSALLELLRSEPTLHRAYAGIALPNPESIALHERLGFERVATYHEVGRKFGKYWDVSWYQKNLSA